MEHQISFQDLLSGRTFQEPSAVTKAKTSRQSYKRSATQQSKGFLFLNLREEGNGLMQEPLWETVSALPGDSMTLNFGESPSDARGSTLSQILDLNAPERYCLSPRACAGIIRRAEKRGKELPGMLRDALMEVIGLGGGLENIEDEPEDETTDLDDDDEDADSE